MKGAEKNIVDGEKGNESYLTLYIKTSSTGVEEKSLYDKVEYANQLTRDDRPDPHKG